MSSAILINRQSRVHAHTRAVMDIEVALFFSSSFTLHSASFSLPLGYTFLIHSRINTGFDVDLCDVTKFTLGTLFSKVIRYLS